MIIVLIDQSTAITILPSNSNYDYKEMITSAIVSTGKVLITSNSYNILNSSDNQDLMTSINNASTEGVVITSNSKNILNDIIIITVSIVTILLFIVLITFISLLLIFKHCRNLNAKKNDVRYEESLQANDNQGNFYDLDLSEENRFSEVLDYLMYESVNNHRRDSENMDYVDMTGSVHSEYISQKLIFTQIRLRSLQMMNLIQITASLIRNGSIKLIVCIVYTQKLIERRLPNYKARRVIMEQHIIIDTISSPL